MDDVREAQALISAIRREKGIDASGELNANAKTLSRTFKLVSSQLYSSNTRFFMELLQNADDNKYIAGTVPRITFLYHSEGWLWVGSNERGFTEQDVRSICDAGDSTKKVVNNAKAQIGEKGIGFKAVFSVASTVYIRSGALSFRFDRDAPLGEILPEWCEFPLAQGLDERTMFCLEIPKAHDRAIVRDELLNLDPEMLLFLRQPKQISIQQVREGWSPVQHLSLYRQDDQVSGIKCATLFRDPTKPAARSSSESYLLFEDRLGGMPETVKRTGVTVTAITMAFPVDASLRAVCRVRDTFNFLLIRSYGFPVRFPLPLNKTSLADNASISLQCDFLLNVPREEILKNELWNHHLAAGSSRLFVQAVEIFNATGVLKYEWPQYARSNPMVAGTIFKGFYEDLRLILQQSAVLETRSGTFALPTTLQTLPAIYSGGANPPKPLLSTPGGLRSCLSDRYDFTDISGAGLGVVDLDGQLFCQQLSGIVREHEAIFRSMPRSWHAKIATAVMHAGVHLARSIKLIPTQNGQWITGNDKPFYFAELEEHLNIPVGIKIVIIESEAGRDESRRRLFAALGAQTLDGSRVFRLIIDQHKISNPRPKTWTFEVVLSHARFCFSTSNKPSDVDVSELRLAQEGRSGLERGQNLYMDSPTVSFSLSAMAAKGCKALQLIDRRYITNVPQAQAAGWMKWLQDNLHVSVVPKLLVAVNRTQLLRDSWEVYAPATRFQSARDFLQNLHVPCTDKVKRPLSEVYLPVTTKAEPLAATYLPVMDLDDPDNEAWKKLSAIGVNTHADVKYYCTILTELAKRVGSNANFEDIKRLYKGIQDHMSGYRSSTTLEFVWISHTEARWSWPIPLPHIVTLKVTYGELEELFRNLLHVQPATVEDLVKGLVWYKGNVSQLQVINNLPCGLSRYVKATSVPDEVLSVLLKAEVKVLPIRTIGGQLELRSAVDPNWYIADTTVLTEIFVGAVDILDFNYGQLKCLAPLLSRLALDSRRLSRIVEQKVKTTGDQVRQNEMTLRLRHMAGYISCLVAPDTRLDTQSRLQRLEVFAVISLTTRRYIHSNMQCIFGKEEEASASMQIADGHFRLYITDQVAKKGRLPEAMVADLLLERLMVQPDKQEYLLKMLLLEKEKDIRALLEQADILGEESISETDLDEAILLADAIDSVTGTSTVELSPIEGHADHTNGTPSSSHCMGRSSADSWVSDDTEDLAIHNAAARSISGIIHEPVVPVSSFRTAHHVQRTIKVNKASFAPSPILTDLDLASHTSKLQIASFTAETAVDAALPESRPIGITQALSIAAGRLNRTAIMQGINVEPSAMQAEADPQQLITGAEGEHHVYKMLKAKFGIGIECWTSNIRAQYGFPAFDKFEGDFADFTIHDFSICRRIIKATTGLLEEPFHLSLNQYHQAYEWHDSERDVYVILRLYDLDNVHRVHAYVDPFELNVKRRLDFTARGGYYVQRNQ